MADPQTPNIGLSVPTRGSDVGTWDIPINGDMSILDACAGGVLTLPLTNINVALDAVQSQNVMVVLTGVLTGNVDIIPTLSKIYIFDNQTTGNFTVRITPPATTRLVALAPGQQSQVLVKGPAAQLIGLPPVGTYLDYAGPSVPVWVFNCSPPPYLNCDGSNFSAATYPALAAILGTTTLPDLRGRSRFALNQGTNRITAGGSGIDGDTRFSGGGSEYMQNHPHSYSGTTGAMNASNPHGHSVTGGHVGGLAAGSSDGNNRGTPISPAEIAVAAADINHGHPYSGLTSAFGAGSSQNMPPAAISGITMIRAG